MEDLRCVAEVDGHGPQRSPGGGIEPAAGGLDEEVEQHRSLAGRYDQQVAARAEPGEQRLGDKGGQHGGDCGVDGVAPARNICAPAFAVAG